MATVSEADKQAFDEFDAENTPVGDAPAEETPVVDDEKSVDSNDEGAADEEQLEGEEEDWVTSDDNRELLESMNLSDDEARKFTGPEELERHQMLLDKRFRDAGKQAEEQETALEAQEAAQDKLDAKERASERERDEDGRFTSKDGDYKPELDENVFDEEVIGEFERLGKHYEERIARLETRYRDAEDRQVNAQFDSVLESLGNEELFGTNEAPNVENRVRVREAFDTIALGMKAQGKSADITPTLLRRAQNLEFADELNKQDRDSFRRTLKGQAQRTLGGGGQRTKPDREKPWTGEAVDDPALKDAYERLEKENGSR